MRIEEDAVHVIDGFLDDPHSLRRLALEADYPTLAEKAYFPGRNSAQTFPIAGLDAAVARITGHAVAAVPKTSHGKFRLSLAGETGAAGVHIDNCHWTGVYSLTLDEHAEGGTDFFRHRPTNTLRAPVYPEDWAAWESKTVEQLWRDVIVPHSREETKWELARRVGLKFNRLLLFRPWLWHNAGPGFGDEVSNGRLIYLLSYNPAA